MPLVALCYHKVGTETEEGRRLNVDPRRLSSHVRFFLRRGYRFERAGEVVPDVAEKTVCFTFDDGFLSTLDHGLPVFARYGVPMTIYAVSERVGQTSAWEGAQARALAPWDRLVEAQETGHEVGNHTATHPRLSELGPDEQLAEIRRCDAALRDRGIVPGSFCYPYGNLNEASLSAVSAAGYRIGMALGKRPCEADDPPLALPRIVMAFGDGLPLLLYKLYLRPHLKK